MQSASHRVTIGAVRRPWGEKRAEAALFRLFCCATKFRPCSSYRQPIAHPSKKPGELRIFLKDRARTAEIWHRTAPVRPAGLLEPQKASSHRGWAQRPTLKLGLWS